MKDKKAKQNISHAVMSRRYEADDSLDDFPTPPWATRALLEHVIFEEDFKILTCLEPACGKGHMAKTLSEYFESTTASDIFDYGYGGISDFTQERYSEDAVDWVITNPPFRRAEEFILKSLAISRRGVAVLVRTLFIESVGRYERIFKNTPPTKIGQFTERVPMIKGRVDKQAKTASGYAWVVWEKYSKECTRLVWIPPCRKRLERENDYSIPVATYRHR